MQSGGRGASKAKDPQSPSGLQVQPLQGDPRCSRRGHGVSSPNFTPCSLQDAERVTTLPRPPAPQSGYR